MVEVKRLLKILAIPACVVVATIAAVVAAKSDTNTKESKQEQYQSVPVTTAE